MSSRMITVPEGMSCVNAFHALWVHAQADEECESVGQSDAVATAEKVADLFKQSTLFLHEGGKRMPTNFQWFPKLNIGAYDRAFGAGAAQKALAEYNKRPSEKRFDQGDTYRFEVLVKG